MKKNYRNPMTRPENFMNPAGNVMKEIKEADLNNFSAGAGEPRVSDGSQFCTSTKECNWGTIMFDRERQQLPGSFLYPKR